MRVVATQNLAALRIAAKAIVDSSAEAYRQNFITPGDGQAMAYREKYNEAIAYMADPDIDEALIPHICAEVGITGFTKYEVCQVVLNMHAMWAQVSAVIENARLGAKENIDAANSPAAINAATEVDWANLIPQ